MGDINPNTPVTEASEPTINIGESPLSFDELDAAISAKKESKARPEKQEKKEAKDESVSKEAKGEKEDKEKKPGKEKDEKLDVKPKTYKAKLRDKELDLDEETQIPVTIDGKEEWISAKDLRAHYSGKVSWDKKFTEIDKIRQGVNKEKSELTKSREMAKAFFEEKDPSLRMFKLAEVAGVSPIDFRKSYFDENLKLLEEYSQMSDADKKAADLEFENSYLKYQSETKDKSLKSQQAQEALDKKINSLLATHGYNIEEFVNQSDLIAPLVEQGRLKPEQLTPEFIVETMAKDRLWNSAEARLGELSLKWTPEQQVKNLRDFVESAYQHGFKPSDVPELVDELWGSKRAHKAVVEKVAEREAFKETKKSVESSKHQGEALFFDEL